jgi:hypothetical protein
MKVILVGKAHGYFSPSSSDLLPDVSADYFQRPLVGEPEMIRTQTGTQ